ncbi:MAG TPA: hypothetical protein VKB93_24645 [Thermoanaerobaculia bacterium]|nr:hypothetical protein [Thermoanaerobaculia bacterium]
MKPTRLIILTLAALLIVTSAFAATKATVTHGKSVHGTIAKLNDGAKTFTVNSGAKKSYSLEWNDATKVTGGSLKDGESATVKYMVHGGKNVATSIMITKKS